MIGRLERAARYKVGLTERPTLSYVNCTHAVNLVDKVSRCCDLTYTFISVLAHTTINPELHLQEIVAILRIHFFKLNNFI